jgi:FMN phosphatase YigB (HAD superfamily)
MACRAVIFDLFGTLIHNFSRSEYRAVLDRMAALLGAPAEEFARAWVATFPERTLGSSATTEDDTARVCRQLHVSPSAARLAAAARLRIDLTRRYLVPRDGALEVLGALRARGVGDGSSRELTGARQAGMRPIHLRPPGEDAEDVHRVDVDAWSGEAVRALAEVLALVQ